jgi:regulator of sigma E protease
MSAGQTTGLGVGGGIALDGGHAVFAIIEWVTGRAPSTRVMEVAQMIGFFLLLTLIVLANGNDLLKALGL